MAQSPPERAEATAAVQVASLADQVQAIIAEYDGEMNAFYEAYQATKDKEARNGLYEKLYPKPGPYMERLGAVVKKAPEDPASLNAIVWMLGNGVNKDQRAEFLGVLVKHHIGADEIGTACQTVSRDASIATEKFLRQVMKSSESHEAVGHATFALASVLGRRISVTESLAKDAEADQSDLIRAYGEDVVKLCEASSAKDLAAERKALLETVRDKFADVPRYRSTLGKAAAGQLFEAERLQIGMVAPDIQGDDLDGVDFKLSDYRGKVVFLDFWGDW